MDTWIIKSQTDDPQRALEIVEDQRSRGYNAWIEDESGKAVDEESLKNENVKPIKPTLREKGMGCLLDWQPRPLRSVRFMQLACGSIISVLDSFSRN